MPEGERRLAAIMFTDMVGYTSLGQRNESLSLTLVEEQRKILRPILARHNGREVKTIGDAFLVVFPNAVDAVRCAYDIQRSVREFNLSFASDKRIHLRVGVHVGEIVESEGDISGDAVNVASRVEPLADDGGVCVSRPVYEFVRNKVEVQLSSMGPQTLKNVNEPMEIYKMIMPWSGGQTAEGRPDKSRVAVLPFANMSPDPNDGYFADGLTEELISTLSAVKGLRVVSRTSTMGYKNSTKRLAEIGKELAAGAIVEGSVRKAGNRVRVTVQLIDAGSDEHLWSEKYDRSLDDIFAIQSEVSEQVAGALRVRLAKSERERVSRAKTSNLTAFQDYLLGKHYFSQSSEEAVRKSMEFFKKAISNDPDFAEAYDGLGRAYEWFGHQGLTAWDESYKQSKSMVEKALELDPSSSEGNATLAWLTLVFGYDAIEAEKLFEKAIALDPSNSFAHRRYARCLAALGRLDEAIVHADEAADLDPLNPQSHSEKGLMLYLDGRDVEAFEVWHRAQELFPGQPTAYFFSILFHVVRGEYVEGEREISSLPQEFQTKPFGLVFRGWLYGHMGNNEEALKMANELRQLVENGRSSADLVCDIYYAMGDYDQWFRWAMEAVRLRHFELFVLKNYAKFYPRNMHDPRWKEVLAEAGLT